MFGAYIQFQALCVEKGHLLVAVLKLSPNNSFKNGSHDFHGIFKDYLPLDFKMATKHGQRSKFKCIFMNL